MHPNPSQEFTSVNLASVRIDEWAMDDFEDSHGRARGTAAKASDGHEQFLEVIDSVLGREPDEGDHGETNLAQQDDADGTDPFHQPYR
jgi:hypothetical protein